MAIPGELGNTAGDLSDECETHGILPLRVLHSAAGWYLGTLCESCGPWARKSGYFGSEAEAEAALADVGVHQRSTAYHGGGRTSARVSA
jgi:hypothetical protein